MNKAYISAFLRKLGLIRLMDRLGFVLQKIKYRRANNAFRKANPDVCLPPDYIIYESFSLNYEAYYNQSKGTAERLTGFFEKHIDLSKVRILDWGCGPGRVIRHFPGLLAEGCGFFATDYNRVSIDWCKEHIPGVQFSVNQLAPPMDYQDGFFDIVYGISVLTHLSEELHHAWFEELCRVCKPGGIMYLTTQGEAFKARLTTPEVARFERGELVVRSKTREGHRTFSAFQPEGFMRKMMQGVEVLEHVSREPEGNYIPQDIWIIKKL